MRPEIAKESRAETSTRSYAHLVEDTICIHAENSNAMGCR